MPLTLEQFLAAEPTLEQLRRELSTADRHDLRRLRSEERALVQMLESRWRLGLAGWMTPDEARCVAAELTTEAGSQGHGVSASVEEGFLVFSGGRYGAHRLHLGSTSPIRARKHWEGYVEASAPRQLQLGGSQR